jgi:hypothetical protein
MEYGVWSSCELDTSVSISLKGGAFLDRLNDCQFLMKDSATYYSYYLVVPGFFK